MRGRGAVKSQGFSVYVLPFRKPWEGILTCRLFPFGWSAVWRSRLTILDALLFWDDAIRAVIMVSRGVLWLFAGRRRNDNTNKRGQSRGIVSPYLFLSFTLPTLHFSLVLFLGTKSDWDAGMEQGGCSAWHSGIGYVVLGNWRLGENATAYQPRSFFDTKCKTGKGCLEGYI